MYVVQALCGVSGIYSSMYAMCVKYVVSLYVCVCERTITSPSSFLWPLTTCNRIDHRDIDHCR